MSLDKEEKVDLNAVKPKLNISKETDPTDNANEQKAFDKEFKGELEDWRHRRKDLENGLEMAYALIKETYCTKTMRDRVEAHPDFETKIKDDPVELLKAIRVLTHDTVRAQYPYVSLVDSVARLMTIKQYDDSLLDYAKRFKQTRDVMKTYIGASLLDAFVERTEEYKAEQDADAKKTMKKDAWNRLMAYLFLKGADSFKYGSLTKKYVTDFSGGEDTYPNTLQTVVDILTNHRFDDTYCMLKGRKRLRRNRRLTV
ncbi:MAG: hypothetical protein ACRCZI_00110, partial [Cetobacterium sp.]